MSVPFTAEEFRAVTLTALFYGPDQQLVDTIVEMESARVGTTTNEFFYINPWFESRAMVQADGRHVVVGHGSTPEFRIFELPGLAVSLSTVVRWQAPDRDVTDDILAAAREATRAQYSGDEAERDLAEMFLDNQRPVADVLPAFTWIRIGSDGSVWIRGYDAVSDASSGEWFRFSSDGILDCRISLPDRSSVLEFGADYLLLLRRNELEVEELALIGWRQSGDII